jgi:hypothetical protein
MARGQFLNQSQNLNFASSKHEVNKFIPIKFATSKFSTDGTYILITGQILDITSAIEIQRIFNCTI